MPSNIEAIVDYFRSGIKQAGEVGRLGVELEHIMIDGDSMPVAYDDEHGSHWLLRQFESEMPNKTLGEGDALIGVASPDVALSLEPAAQVEISAGPYKQAGEARLDFEGLQRLMSDMLSPYNRRLITLGYHPTAKANELQLIPKGRYRHMDAHFSKFGPYGRCMMRGSAATQISIDYYSDEDCLRKLRLASGIAPLLALLCDNAPVFEGKRRAHHMVRTKIWRECDPDRCGLVPGVMDPSFTLEDYASYVLRTPAIFEVDENGSSHATDKTFGELHDNSPMTEDDIEHALSLFFNDVRLKTYIEIRPADSMPTPFVASYAALIKGLFYYDQCLDALDELLEGVTADDVERAKTDLMSQGYNATVYGKGAGETIDTLFDLARQVLPGDDRVYLGALSQLARSRKTLAMLEEKTLKL